MNNEIKKWKELIRDVSYLAQGHKPEIEMKPEIYKDKDGKLKRRFPFKTIFDKNEE